ncbi:hypothetical protein BDW22DRAFT_1193983 [Trametopsis cervina]|nr:hypothetical protein BDW22DRAFT_1193983 [Trametopsis cervina]
MGVLIIKVLIAKPEENFTSWSGTRQCCARTICGGRTPHANPYVHQPKCIAICPCVAVDQHPSQPHLSHKRHYRCSIVLSCPSRSRLLRVGDSNTASNAHGPPRRLSGKLSRLVFDVDMIQVQPCLRRHKPRTDMH